LAIGPKKKLWFKISAFLSLLATASRDFLLFLASTGSNYILALLHNDQLPLANS
jgi:hypothetical protein